MSRLQACRFGLSILGWTLGLSLASAQTPPVPLPLLPNATNNIPDAGQTSQQLNQGSLPVPAPAGNIELDLPAATAIPAAAPSTETLNVKSFALRGNTVFDDARLLSLVNDVIGQDLDFAKLQTIAGRITTFYRSRGYQLAQAYLPPQTIADGKVQIEIEEGRLGKVVLQNSSKFPDSRILGVLAAQGCPFKPNCTATVLNINKLEHALLQLNGLPGVNSQATLSAGEKTGTSDLLLNVQTPALRPWNGYVGIDNYGNGFTGRNRLRFGLTFDNPSGTLADQLNLQGLTSGRGLQNFQVDYKVPVGSSGLKMGIDVSRVEYQLGGAFAATDTTGSADVVSLVATYPLILQLDKSLVLQGSLSSKKLKDDYGQLVSFDKHTDTAVLGIAGNFNNSGFRQGGAGTYDLLATAGQLHLDEVSAANDDLTANSRGHFSKLNFSGAYQQFIGRNWALYGALRGQRASKNLDSSERFFLGGPDAVRAYASGQASGDEGALATLELRKLLSSFYTVPGQLTLFAFIDRGWVKVNHTAWLGYNGPETRTLGGGGVGLSWRGAGGAVVSTSLATRNNDSSATLQDARTRLWVTLLQSF